MATALLLLLLWRSARGGVTSASPSPHEGATSASGPSVSSTPWQAANVTDMPEASVGAGVKPSQGEGGGAAPGITRILTIGLAVGGVALAAVGVAAVALGRRRAAPTEGEGGGRLPRLNGPPRPAPTSTVLRRTVAATHIRSSTTTVDAPGVDKTGAVPTGGSAWSDLAWTAGSQDFDVTGRQETVDEELEELEVLEELELDLSDLHQSARELHQHVEGRRGPPTLGTAFPEGGGTRRRLSLEATGAPTRGGGGQGEDV
jgi:hypothetical protein